MTIVVTAPNGAMVQFPDGTDHATINGVMTQHFGGAQATPADPVTTNDVVRSAATGVPIIGGLLNKADAATNAALAPVLNPLFDQKDQLQEPTFGERYAHSLRDQQGTDAKFEAQHPVIDTAAKLAGGAAAMAPALAAAPGLLGATGTLGARVVNGGISNAVIGGADSAARGGSPVTGALVGGALGAALPAATAAIGHIAVNNPITSNLAARFDPTGFAQRQVARGVADSGLTGADIEARVAQAAQEGQPEFNVADAMGNSGQRMLSTVARAPGEGRTAVVNDLEARQMGQGRRVANALAEGFDAPETAAQTEARLTAARGAAADTEYGAVRNDAGPVDVTGAIGHIDRTLGPAQDQMLENVGGAAPNDSIETALLGFRNRLSRVNPNDFASVQRIRGDMADAAQSAMQSGYGNKARLLGGAVRQLDAAMEAASPGHAAANANFRQASRNIDAVDQGRTAATGRIRTEDVIPAFQGLQPEGQTAFRSGYVDPLIEKVRGAADGANKARPLMNDAFRDEAAVMAPGNPLMQRRLGRENTMFETRQQALGGSRTADNLADQHAMGIDPHLVGAIGHVLSGNIGGAVRSVGSLVANGWSGNTPQVRAEVARILLQRAPNMRPGALQAMTDQTIARLQRVESITHALTRGASGGLLPVVNSQ